MNINLKLGVYRRLDNRAEGLGDDSPRAIELHNRRKKALSAGQEVRLPDGSSSSVLDTLLGTILDAAQGGSSHPGRLAGKIVFLIPMIRGVRAVRVMKGGGV